MNKKKKQNRFWNFYFGTSSYVNIPEHIQRLSWKDQSVSDEDLEFLSLRIKSIYQMDLDNNLITNKGLEYLTRITIDELRLKGLNIDDEAIKHILKIPGLKLLHIGGTNISSEGVERLSAINTLETLICSPDPIDNNHLKRFKESLPNCELIVGYKVFEE